MAAGSRAIQGKNPGRSSEAGSYPGVVFFFSYAEADSAQTGWVTKAPTKIPIKANTPPIPFNNVENRSLNCYIRQLPNMPHPEPLLA